MKTRKTFICEWCGKEFESANYEKGRQYCSRRCYEKDKSYKALISNVCWGCGKRVVRKKCEFRAARKHFYCSRLCALKDTMTRRKGEYLKCSHCGKVRYCSRSVASLHKTDLCMVCNQKTNRKTIEAMHRARQEQADRKPVACAQCGKTNMLSKKQREAYPTHFCGIRCAHKHRGRNKVALVCVECKKEFLVSPSARDRKYCSRKCHGIEFGRGIRASWKNPEYIARHSGPGHPFYGKERTKEVRELLSKTTKAAWDGGKIYPKLLRTRFSRMRKLNDVDELLIRAMEAIRNAERRNSNEEQKDGGNGPLVRGGEHEAQ